MSTGEDQDSGADESAQSRSSVHVLGVTIGFGLGFTVIIAAVVGSAAYGGYRVGLGEQRVIAATAAAEEWDEQYKLAVDDIESGDYLRAVQRLEHIESSCPSCSGVSAKLALARESLGNPLQESTSTPWPSYEEATPENALENLIVAYHELDWGSVVKHATHLRTKHPEFERSEVGGMLFVGLKNRGIQQIEEGIVELGIADLEHAAEVGPLDAEARQYLRWASLYLYGMSFWELHWPIVINNLSLLYQTGPDFRDVKVRLREAYVAWGDTLLLDGDYCAAQMQYANAMSMADSSSVIEKHLEAKQACPQMTPSLEAEPALDVP